MKEGLLFDKAQKAGIPFFQWHKWLETTLNQEVMKHLFQRKQRQEQGGKASKQDQQKEKVKENLSKYLQETRRKSTT